MCTHEETDLIKDMPICDAEFNFLGRFDVTMCLDCGEILDQQVTDVDPPVLIRGQDLPVE
jgi:hypothetical protein